MVCYELLYEGLLVRVICAVTLGRLSRNMHSCPVSKMSDLSSMTLWEYSFVFMFVTLSVCKVKHPEWSNGRYISWYIIACVYIILLLSPNNDLWITHETLRAYVAFIHMNGRYFCGHCIENGRYHIIVMWITFRVRSSA